MSWIRALVVCEDSIAELLGLNDRGVVLSSSHDGALAETWLHDAGLMHTRPAPC